VTNFFSLLAFAYTEMVFLIQELKGITRTFDKYETTAFDNRKEFL